MASLYIEVFRSVDRDAGRVYLPMAPATPIQTMIVSTSASSVQSSVLSDQANFVRLCADENVVWAHGTNPDADASGQYLPAGIPEWRYVVPGARIAVRSVGE